MPEMSCTDPDAEGNIHDHAPLEQPSSPTSSSSFQRFSFQRFSFYPMFSVLIRQGLPQPERLATLNDIAITQMKTLLSANSANRLKDRALRPG